MKSKNFSTVTELTVKIKDLLENNFFNVFVKGEISNFIHHGSGHMYFTLKDRNSEIKSVMFRGSNQNLNFQPANGVEVFFNIDENLAEKEENISLEFLDENQNTIKKYYVNDKKSPLILDGEKNSFVWIV